MRSKGARKLWYQIQLYLKTKVSTKNFRSALFVQVKSYHTPNRQHASQIAIIDTRLTIELSSNAGNTERATKGKHKMHCNLHVFNSVCSGHSHGTYNWYLML